MGTKKQFFWEGQLPATFFATSQAASFGISAKDFDELLRTVAGKYLPTGSTRSQTIEFCRHLHLRDLALAQACVQGDEAAWEIFFERYGKKLYWTACKLVKNEPRARELADTLCADLFAPISSRKRESKLASYTGRGSLDSWLRATLFQANIDSYRLERRYTSFDEIAVSLKDHPLAELPEEALENTQLENCLREAIHEAASEDRFILAAYFLDRRNLAEIAAVLRVHESTVSRRLDRALRALRRNLAGKLRDGGMSQDSVNESLKRSLTEVSFDIRSELLMGVEMIEEGS